MNRTRAAVLLLCAASIAPSLAFAVTQDPVPDVHRQSLVLIEPDALALADAAISPPQLQLAPPPQLPTSHHPDDLHIHPLFTREALFGDGTWIDKHVLQALNPQDTVVKVRKWWAKQPKAKTTRAPVLKTKTRQGR